MYDYDLETSDIKTFRKALYVDEAFDEEEDYLNICIIRKKIYYIINRRFFFIKVTKRTLNKVKKMGYIPEHVWSSVNDDDRIEYFIRHREDGPSLLFGDSKLDEYYLYGQNFSLDEYMSKIPSETKYNLIFKLNEPGILVIPRKNIIYPKPKYGKLKFKRTMWF